MGLQKPKRFPYGEMDPPVQPLCRAINAFPGVFTIGSCGGHAEGGELPADQWRVDFRAEVTDDHRPTVDAWLSAEFIAWVLRDLYRGDMAVFASFWSPPPYLNYPGQMLTFEIHGWRPSAEPEEVAAQLKAFRRGQYVGARAVHLYCESD